MAQGNQLAPSKDSLGVIKETSNHDSVDLDSSSSSRQEGDSSVEGSTSQNGDTSGGNNKNVMFSKFIVVFVLLVSAIVTGTLTYFLLSEDAEQDFHNNVSSSFFWPCLLPSTEIVVLSRS